MASYGRNVIANIVSQVFVAAVGIATIPFLVRVMGAEAFGLIGFFTLLQAWFQLLDMGMTPTLSRETARFCGGSLTVGELRQLLKVMESLFVAVAVAGALGLALGSGFIARSWLHVEALPLAEVRLAILLMGVVIALRWVGGVYRGAIAGFEEMVWLGVFSSTIATFRFVLVVPLLHHFGGRPSFFFLYQAFLAVLELGVLRLKLYRLVPRTGAPAGPTWNWAVVKPILVFSASIAFTSSIWVLVTQMDKLVLSKVLSLSDFGYFTMAVAVAGGISLLSGPIAGALMPRMARMVAAKDEDGMIQLYRDATQMVAILVMPAALLLSCFAAQILFAWTGNPLVAAKAAPVLRLYAIGNGILAMLAFQYYLQYAKGNLKLHVIGNVIMVLLLIPSVVWATVHFGMVGAGSAWVAINSLYLLFWAPFIHSRYVPGLHRVWLRVDIGHITVPVAAVAGSCALVLTPPASRAASGLEAVAIGILLGLTAIAGSSWGRGQVRRALGRLRAPGSATLG